MDMLPLLAGSREAYANKKAGMEWIKPFRLISRLFNGCRARLLPARAETEAGQLLITPGRASLGEHGEWKLPHHERPLEREQSA